MRPIASRILSVFLCLALSLGTLSFSLAYPKRAYAVVPVIGAAAAAGLSDAAVVGAFAAFAAACGFSISSAVGADSTAPVASWTDEQLDRAGQILQGWMDRADQTLGSVELGQILQASPEPPEDPDDDPDDDDIPVVEGEKVQPTKSDANGPIDYMLAMMAVNGAVGLTGGFADLIGSFVDYATAPESEGGAGFSSTGDVLYPDVTSSDGRWNFPVAPYSNPLNLDLDPSLIVASTGLVGNDGLTYTNIYNGATYTDAGTGYIYASNSFSFNSDTGLFTINGYYEFPATYTYGGTSSTRSIAGGTGEFTFDGSLSRSSQSLSPAFQGTINYISPAAAKLVDSSYAPITSAGLLYQIAGQNAQMQDAMQQMANDIPAAIATLQNIYADDVSTTPAGTTQYLTVQAPYYVESGKTDPQTGTYTANIVANDYNHGTISDYQDAVATNTSSPQPGNTGYSPSDYKGNSSSDQPPWQPLLEIHLDRVWPFSLIGDSYRTFQDVYSLDGGSEWDWHIIIPLSSWNIALGGADVFDDYDLDLSMWRDLFAYLAPWFLLYVFLALLAMARRLWLRWNDSSGGDD